MKFKTLKQIIKNNGGTFAKNKKPVNFKNGYQVSFRDVLTIKIDDLQKNLDKINTLFDQIEKDQFVGFWIFENMIYIDLSKRITNKAEAIAFGREKAQKSIFDWQSKDCIFL